ncbi:extracellular solute-binding protein, partial [candidate division WOR-3 bacterium]|nr:extracellular solute-binding protein [candidate division WOR-3 bacterium]
MMTINRLAVAGFALVLLAGCGGGEQGGPQAAGKVRVTFWHAMGGPLGDALKTMVEEFEAANPDVDIDPVSMGGYPSLSQKLMGALQVDAPPNMAQMYESWTTQFHELGKLVPLDSFVRGDAGLSEAELADFYPAFIEDNSWNGRIVTLPFNKSVPVYFYNIGMLEAAGYDRFPDTWDGFRQMAKKLTDRDKGIWGTAGGVNEWQFGCMLRQLGGDFLDETGAKAVFNSDAGVKAAEYQRALMADDSSAMFAVGYDVQNDFLSGKIGCIWGTSVSWAYMQDKMTFPVGVAAIPTWDGNQDVLSFGTNIGVFRAGTP